MPRRKLAPQPEPGEPGTVRGRRSGSGGKVYWHPIDANGQESPAGYADKAVAERKAREALEYAGKLHALDDEADELDVPLELGTRTVPACGHRHRSYRTRARCRWPRSAWVYGEGPWASVAYCHVTTVMLHDSRAAAANALAVIEGTGCGHACYRRHELAYLEGG